MRAGLPPALPLLPLLLLLATPSDAPAAPLPPPARLERDLEYARPGGEHLGLDVCTPAGRGPFPAAILVHEGGWTSGDRTQASRALVRLLTTAGIAWLSVSYGPAEGAARGRRRL